MMRVVTTWAQGGENPERDGKWFPSSEKGRVLLVLQHGCIEFLQVSCAMYRLGNRPPHTSIALLACLLFVYRQAVALVYEHEEGGPSRAVCVDKGLDFTIGEMSTGDLGPLSNNRLFRGGDVRLRVCVSSPRLSLLGVPV